MRLRYVGATVLLIFLGIPLWGQTKNSGSALLNVFTNKARYSPKEEVLIEVESNEKLSFNSTSATLEITFWHIGERVGEPIKLSVDANRLYPQPIEVAWMPPDKDFQGYLVHVRLVGPQSHLLAEGNTAVDVSSSWQRFPRYGYIAQFNKAEGADPSRWIAELNTFHIDGLEYYDFEYRHDKPLAGSVEHPAPTWKDIANRTINGRLLDAFLRDAHRYNMMNMAYDSGYSAYPQSFSMPSGPKLAWAIWPKPDGPRTLASTMSLDLGGEIPWKTKRLIYMNLNSDAWQHYIFTQMQDLFRVYSFDGWHIDTFGTRGGYNDQGQYVNFINGLPAFIDHAHSFLHVPIVLNTVNTWGEAAVARSQAAFVYSELWQDHETYSSILATADEVHVANPRKSLVFAAYMQRPVAGVAPPKTRYFNTPSVLLTDAVIFAAGASHIELGDGDRMLSSEYFPADTRYALSASLLRKLRNYYDFLTAYENVLRYNMSVAPCTASVLGYPVSPYGVPNAIWTIAREKGSRTVLHLINLMGSDDPYWRDSEAQRKPPPLLTHLALKIAVGRPVVSVGWATPDLEDGMYHSLLFKSMIAGGQRYVLVKVPSLRYWDLIFLNHK